MYTTGERTTSFYRFCMEGTKNWKLRNLGTKNIEDRIQLNFLYFFRVQVIYKDQFLHNSHADKTAVAVRRLTVSVRLPGILVRSVLGSVD